MTNDALHDGLPEVLNIDTMAKGAVKAIQNVKEWLSNRLKTSSVEEWATFR